METKKLIKEKLEFHKRQTIANEVLNRAANNLFDAYRDMELALQFCDNPEMRSRVEDIKDMLGRGIETHGSIQKTEPTVISHLQQLMSDFSE